MKNRSFINYTPIGVYISLFFNCLVYAEQPMSRLEILKDLEHFYEAIHPAQENNRDVYAWFCEIPHPFLNVVIRLSSTDVSAKVDALIEQNSPDKPMSFWVHSENQAEGLVDLLKERRFSSMDAWPAMSWSVQSVALPLADIRPAEREVFYEILYTVYAVDAVVRRDYPKLMDALACESYILYADGEPISIASLFVHGKVAEIFNDATLPGRREASAEMMRFLMHRSQELKVERLITLSSPEAEELYAELGFDKILDIEVFARDSSSK